MAKKKSGKKASGTRRKRRSSDEMIADLQAQIEQVKERAQARKLKESPSMKRTITIMRSLNKALEEAAEEKYTALRHALADARKPLAEFLETQGVKPPRSRSLPRGRRPSA